jgi:hypothetical protein
MHRGGAAEIAAAFRTLGLRQVAFAGTRAQNLSARRDLKTFGHGLFGFDAFGTSHKFSFEKSAQYREPQAVAQVIILSARAAFSNPNRIASFSPGLRGTSYPG